MDLQQGLRRTLPARRGGALRGAAAVLRRARGRFAAVVLPKGQRGGGGDIPARWEKLHQLVEAPGLEAALPEDGLDDGAERTARAPQAYPAAAAPAAAERGSRHPHFGLGDVDGADVRHHKLGQHVLHPVLDLLGTFPQLRLPHAEHVALQPRPLRLVGREDVAGVRAARLGVAGDGDAERSVGAEGTRDFDFDLVVHAGQLTQRQGTHVAEGVAGGVGAVASARVHQGLCQFQEVLAVEHVQHAQVRTHDPQEALGNLLPLLLR